jgi:RNA polymerase sigma-70 factor (ECF subfamily)
VPAPAATPDFETVCEQHADFAWRVLRRHGVAERDIEDLCQEVFVVVSRKLGGFEGRSSLKTWIYGICRRVAGNHRNRAATHREVSVHEPPPPASGELGDGEAFERLAGKQGLALLEGLLMSLPAERREVFLLYEIEELSMREVAAVLGCSPNTAFSRLYAARRDLKAALARLRARRRVA